MFLTYKLKKRKKERKKASLAILAVASFIGLLSFLLSPILGEGTFKFIIILLPIIYIPALFISFFTALTFNTTQIQENSNKKLYEIYIYDQSIIINDETYTWFERSYNVKINYDSTSVNKLIKINLSGYKYQKYLFIPITNKYENKVDEILKKLNY